MFSLRRKNDDKELQVLCTPKEAHGNKKKGHKLLFSQIYDRERSRRINSVKFGEVFRWKPLSHENGIYAEERRVI